MITWIQNTFQHHFRSIFAVLLVLIIISFVFAIGPQSRMWGRDQRVKKREFFGYNLAAQSDVEHLARDAQISVLLNYGYSGASGEQLLEYAKMRVTSLHLADQIHLPPPTEAQLKQDILKLRAFADEKGVFDNKRYVEFQESLKKNPRMTVADVTRVLIDDHRITEAQKIVGGPGYALESSVLEELSLANTEWTIRVAQLDYASFNVTAKPTEEQLAAYYESNKAIFAVGPRASLDAVLFRAGSFPDATPFTEEQLAQFFEQNKYRFNQPAAAPGTAPVPATDLASVRPQVEAAFRLAAAGQRAAKAASDFAYAIFEKKLGKNAPELDALAKQFGGLRAPVPPFGETGPAGANWPKQVVDEAFTLGDDRHFSDPLSLGGDQVVLLWKETLPGYTPALAEVREPVLAKYLENEKRKTFSESGTLWKSVLTAKLAAGTAFDAAVAALPGAPKVEVKTVAPFTRRQRPEGVAPTVLNALDRLQPGQVSELLLGGEQEQGNGFFVQLVERKAPAVDASSPEYANIRKALGGRSASAFASAVFRNLQLEQEKAYATPAVVAE